MKRWHGWVVAVAIVAIGAYLAMIVGPGSYLRRRPVPIHSSPARVSFAPVGDR